MVLFLKRVCVAASGLVVSVVVASVVLLLAGVVKLGVFAKERISIKLIVSNN